MPNSPSAKGNTTARQASRSLRPPHCLRRIPCARWPTIAPGRAEASWTTADGALDYFESAYTSAATIVDSRNALWGQFSAAFELEQSLASDLLDRFTSVGPPDQSTLVRGAHGSLMLAVRDGGLEEALPQAVATTELVDQVDDPLIRSSFWYGYADSSNALWSSTTSLSRQRKGALWRRTIFVSSLRSLTFSPFVQRPALVFETSPLPSLRSANVERWAEEMNDVFLSSKARALKCRLYISQGLGSGGAGGSRTIHP